MPEWLTIRGVACWSWIITKSRSRRSAPTDVRRSVKQALFACMAERLTIRGAACWSWIIAKSRSRRSAPTCRKQKKHTTF
ncbi:hypothetical protein E2R51_00915 [Jeotgalibacillus sp. S-D1]|uniref:hypothetical protein n=1 Tax=Jeotgalibacillus sp. S-D1 TaxID=2552189 RepID=UPI00105AA62A|nr:hypothetical protein [Jeotgalibacillus sp. S-D1]TDL34308.1 hypothetical protein E2R51_00915 [Jeotgalibacillus sp. S-D1]